MVLSLNNIALLVQFIADFQASYWHFLALLYQLRYLFLPLHTLSVEFDDSIKNTIL